MNTIGYKYEARVGKRSSGVSTFEIKPQPLWRHNQFRDATARKLFKDALNGCRGRTFSFDFSRPRYRLLALHPSRYSLLYLNFYLFGLSLFALRESHFQDPVFKGGLDFIRLHILR